MSDSVRATEDPYEHFGLVCDFPWALGAFAELRHRAKRLDQAADKILALHQSQDKQGLEPTQALEPKRQACIEALRKEAKRTREFLATAP